MAKNATNANNMENSGTSKNVQSQNKTTSKNAKNCSSSTTSRNEKSCHNSNSDDCYDSAESEY